MPSYPTWTPLHVLYPSGRHVPPKVVAFVQAISEAFRLLLDDAPSSAQRRSA
jgi:DNA-binding transcriptional LysR family regulator